MLERNQHGQHYETYGSCGFTNYRLINGWIADIARAKMDKDAEKYIEDVLVGSRLVTEVVESLGRSFEEFMRNEANLTGNDELTQFNGYMSESKE